MRDTVRAAWPERVVERSEAVQRTRARQVEQGRAIVAAARRLIDAKGDNFTIQELVKEASVALQTFYKTFGGKDQLLLAVFEDLIAEGSARFEEEARHLPGPIERLHFYVTTALLSLTAAPAGINPRFMTAEHWRLHERFPEEAARATQPFADMVARQLVLANDQGLLASPDPARDAWFVAELVTSVFHHCAFAGAGPDPARTAEQLWSFCLRALGGGAPAP
jgi:AcrR family transcriptional regulator